MVLKSLHTAAEVGRNAETQTNAPINSEPFPSPSAFPQIGVSSNHTTPTTVYLQGNSSKHGVMAAVARRLVSVVGVCGRGTGLCSRCSFSTAVVPRCRPYVNALKLHPRFQFVRYKQTVGSDRKCEAFWTNLVCLLNCFKGFLFFLSAAEFCPSCFAPLVPSNPETLY